MPDSPPVKPRTQQPEHPEFWDKRFSEGTTPWNAGGVPSALRSFVQAESTQAPGLANRRMLVPGCGHAWEAAWLAEQGMNVTALDFSATAVAEAARTLGTWSGTLLQADFFSFPPTAPFDLVYERAFLCALPRRIWPDYGARMYQLMAPRGRLIGFFFFSDEPKGPPFGIQPEVLDALLAPWFKREADLPVTDSIPVFSGKERWQVWRRRD
ncbi:MAG: methyltransferase domain-containing protein [Zoogloeaceae bacterium]|nr:methyltransferase domain-containing protein [Zoogloeaceae bacterium]